jgi:predicted  nucleic acid-binding Zn-ribbon protein
MIEDEKLRLMISFFEISGETGIAVEIAKELYELRGDYEDLKRQMKNDQEKAWSELAEKDKEIRKLECQLEDAKNDKSVCVWNYYSSWEEDYWETSCGKTYVIIDGLPSENNYKFCPECGRKLIE